VLFSCDFELDQARMDLLNLSDGIFREFVHNLSITRHELQMRAWPFKAAHIREWRGL